MKKGVIFDLDGTLWDACEGIAVSWKEYLREHEPQLWEDGIKIEPDQIRSLCGQKMTAFGDTIFWMLPLPRRYEVLESCEIYEVEYMRRFGGKLYPGLKETLRKLREKYHLYIVSNCQTGYIESFTYSSQTADMFEDTEDFGTTGLDKDQNIRLLFERNKLDAAVYVGDTRGDLKSAVKAGLPFIQARYGFETPIEGTAGVDTFAQLPDAVAAVLG